MPNQEKEPVKFNINPTMIDADADGPSHLERLEVLIESGGDKVKDHVEKEEQNKIG